MVSHVHMCNTDTILDSGASHCMFPLNYPNLRKFEQSKSYATMADQSARLTLYGTAKYGTFDVIVADVQRPLISEGVLTGPPYNMNVVKSGNHAWILDSTKEESASDYIVCHCTREHDNLYHIVDPTQLLKFQQPISISYGLINNVSTTLQLKGNRQLSHNQSYGNLNPLEVLHVILGHLSEQQIKRIVKNNLVNGLKFSYDKIKHLKLGLCPICVVTKMKAFPVYRSLSIKKHGIFEYISFDIIEFGQHKLSIDGYRYVALFVDQCTNKLMVYGMKTKDELLINLKLLIHQYGPTRNQQSCKLKFLNCDSGSEQLGQEFLSYCQLNSIYLMVSAPYKHQQNLVECFVEAVKNGVRVAMMYNKAPYYLWYHAIVYYIHTYNQVPTRSDDRSKDEHFYGVKSDVSTAVPFYAVGYFHIPKELRDDKVYGSKASQCRFIGYADDVNWTNSPQISARNKTNFVSYKDSYILLLDQHKRIIRHDVIFELYSNQPTILNAVPTDRNPTTTNSDSDPSNQQFIEEFDQQLGQTIRDPLSIFSKSALQEKSSESNVSEENQQQETEKRSTDSSRSKRSERSTDKYLLYKSNLSAKHPTISQVDSSADDSPKSLLIPLTLAEALAGPDSSNWFNAWQKELNKISDRKTWVPATDGEKAAKLSTALKSKFTFRLTCLNDGSWKYKVRLVACGYSQIAGSDFHETFAPTARFKSICIVLNLATICNWDIQGLDIENAFLESDLDEVIYMKLPTDVYCESTGQPVIVKLQKSLYGLKQAGELFYRLMRSILILEPLSMKCCIHDMCVFTTHNVETSESGIVVLWVDDIIVTGNSRVIIDRIIKHIEDHVTKMSNMGEISRYIGLDITRDRAKHTLVLTQVPYVKSVIGKLGPNLKPTKVPLNPYHDYREVNTGESNKPLHVELGSLRYIADRTKPSLQLSLSLLQAGANNPTQIQIDGVKHVIRYLTGTVHEGLSFARGLDSEPLVELFGLCDASYIPAHDSRGQLAFALFLNLNSGTVEAKSVKDTTVSTSATHVELKAMYLCLLAIIWARGFLTELGFPPTRATTIWSDSASARQLVNSFHLSAKSQHLTMRVNAINQEVVNGVVEIKYIDTENNSVDVLTKALPIIPFVRHTNTLQLGHANRTIRAKAEKAPRPISFKAKLKKITTAKVRHFAHTN